MSNAKACPEPDSIGTSSSPTEVALVVILPILGLLKIDLVGQLFVHELVLVLLIFPLLLKNITYISNADSRIIVVVIIMWLGGQVLTDVIRNTPSEDYLRGWAKISFFLIGFSALVCLLKDSRLIILWIFSSCVPLLVRPFVLFGGATDVAVLWKFGVGPAVLMISCLPFFWRLAANPDGGVNIRNIAYLHFLFGFISFFLNARSFAGLSITIGLLILGYAKHRGERLSVRHLAMAGIAFVLLANVLAVIYSYGASSGFFGAEAQAKYEAQQMHGGGVVALLLGGRSEAMVSTIAIADSPLIGHGSWAKNFEYSMIYADMRRSFGELNDVPTIPETQQGLIPSHSYLLGAWVESGVLGAFFWFASLLWIVLRVLPAAWTRGDAIGLYVVMSTPIFFWNVLFSPFGAHVRVDVAGYLAICVFVTACERRSGARHCH